MSALDVLADGARVESRPASDRADRLAVDLDGLVHLALALGEHRQVVVPSRVELPRNDSSVDTKKRR